MIVALAVLAALVVVQVVERHFAEVRWTDERRHLLEHAANVTLSRSAAELGHLQRVQNAPQQTPAPNGQQVPTRPPFEPMVGA